MNYVEYFRLVAMKDAAIDTKSDLPCEYLYGRAGYLYALAYVNQHIKPEPIEDELFRSVSHFQVNQNDSIW